jgi:hypothetical protein
MAKVREGYLRESEDYHDDDAVYRVVDACARCNKRYPSADCCTCVYNVANYNVPPARASLLRTDARLAFQQQQAYVERYNKEVARKERGHTVSTLFQIALVIALVVLIPKACSYRSPARIAAFEPTKPVPVTVAPATAYSVAKVREALNNTHRALIDITRDGKINCQDYSIIFRRYYGAEAQLYHMPAGRRREWPAGHLYVRVKSADGYVYIEPQSTGGDWLMRDSWPGTNYITDGYVDYERSFMR